MREFWKTIQVCFTLMGGWLGWFLGGCDGLFITLVVFVLTDYIFGITCAASERRLSSKIGFQGILNKILIFMIVGVANVIDLQLIKTGNVLRTATIFFYLSNEGISIAENASRIGLPLPEALVDVLKELHGKNNDNDENDE